MVFAVIAGVCLSGAVSHAAFQPDRNAVLAHLNAIINWYRDATANAQPGELPSDAIFQQNVRTLAAQAVQLAFQSARAQAALLGESGGATTDGTPQNYAQVEDRISQHLADDQSQLDALNKQIPPQSGSKRKNLLAQRDALTGQISLDKAMLDAIQKMSAFVELNAVNKQGLEGSIDDLANSVPEVVASHNAAAAKKAAPAAAPTTVRSSGLIGELVTLYDQVQSMRRINRLLGESSRVTATANTMRDPLRATIRTIIGQGQQDLSQTPANAAATQTQPQNYAQLTKQFNQVAAAVLPLSQEIMVLDESRSNLEQWRSSISSESKRDLIALLFRVFGIAIALGIVWALSEVWRRLTFRYVHDARRRRQFLLLRRFVMGFFFTMVVVMGFVSEFSSLATYAGFVTAGIAVGLQTLLLSVAAYFFVVGRYGIRIGDRVSVAGVTGDVVDVGLVRLYLMELAGTGVDLYPTGRIAVFANSVLFQPTTPLYKQVPGTEYAWHEVSIALAPGGNHKLVQDKAFAAVNAVYGEYREVMESQQGTIGDRMEIILKAPAPEAKFQLTDDGPTMLIRYPVLLKRSSEIDDRVAQALIDAIRGDEAMKAAISGTPKVRAAVKG
ncbi:MAG TPA: mechanosensitive ion channel family protein [Candidatus Acidoferrales bacterium]|nr:mechanosensitive ion channel family protein [Candidatus Acidoferrales bacterium]